MCNLKSKGFAERNIQTVENILQKCDDPYLASTKPLLWITSRSLRHANGKLKTRLLVCHRAFLNSTNHVAVKTKFLTRQEKQARFYNQNSGPPRNSFEPDQPIRMCDHHSQA